MTTAIKQAWKQIDHFVSLVDQDASSLLSALDGHPGEKESFKKEFFPRYTKVVLFLGGMTQKIRDGKKITNVQWKGVTTNLKEIGEYLLQLHSQLGKNTDPETLVCGLGQNFNKLTQLVETCRQLETGSVPTE